MLRNDLNIIFNDNFNEDLFNGSPLIPLGIERLTFGKNFNKPLGYIGFGSYLPLSVKSIELSDKFNQSIDFLPNGLTNLQFSKNSVFNMLITRWPNELEILRFGDNFNTPLYSLPPNLKILEFGNNFNQPINPLIYPKKLFTISFGNAFNQYIDDLPDSVENIKLGSDFNQEIFYLPRNLKYIEFGSNFNKKNIFNIFPQSIKKIKIHKAFQFTDEICEKFGEFLSVY